MCDAEAWHFVAWQWRPWSRCRCRGIPVRREGGASPAGSLQADAVQLAGELGAAEPEVIATTEHESQAPVLRAQDLVRDLY